MRILCSECFNQIIDINKGIAVCSHCGKEFNIKEKTDFFKIRIDGGYIKENLTYEDIVSGIKTGAIMYHEYIGSMNGPWIHIYDSIFGDLYKAKQTEKEATSKIILYKKQKKKITMVSSVSFLLFISICVNFILLILLYLMSSKFSILLEEIMKN